MRMTKTERRSAWEDVYKRQAPSTLSYLEAEWIRILSGNGEPLEPTLVREDGSGGLPSFRHRKILYFHQRRVLFDYQLLMDRH